MKRTGAQLAKSYGMLLVGAAVYVLAFDAFFVPNDVAFGGVTGLAQILNFFVPQVPVGTMVILFNIPLFLLGWRLFGRHMLISSLFAMTVSSLFIDLLPLFCKFSPMEDKLLACIFGGVVVGGGVGITFLQGATTGGTEIVARLLKLKLSWLPMGKLLLLADLTVVALVALVFRSMGTALYGIVALYISTVVMDWVLYGMDNAKVAYIISDHPQEIARVVMEEMERTVTYLEGEGGYTGQSKKVILCAFKQRQVVAIKEAVRRADPNAFMIVTNAHEVLGEGFGSYHGEL